MQTATTFVAECLWPNVTRSDVDALVRRIVLHGREGVEHVGATLVPEDDVVFVWFDAESARDVEGLCLAASVPFDRIVAVTDWSATQLRPPHERTTS